MPRMTPDEARRRFTAARVARLATVDPTGRPHLVPVVFAARGPDALVMAVDAKPKTTTRLKRLRNIAAHPSVCLLADAYDEDWDRLWWARADGDARVLTDPTNEDHATALAALSAKYPQYVATSPTGPVVVVHVLRWAGWTARDEPDRRAPPLRHHGTPGPGF